jgi:hypothetical protein
LSPARDAAAEAAPALFLIEWAAVSVINVAETLFLKRIGVERLPIAFLLISLLLAGTSVAVGRLAAGKQPRAPAPAGPRAARGHPPAALAHGR